MDEEQNPADLIHFLESHAQTGDHEHLSAVYVALHEKGLLTTTGIEAIIGKAHLMGDDWAKLNTVSAAAVTALGDILSVQAQEGKTPDQTTINYLKWNITEFDSNPSKEMSTPIRSLLKIVNAGISAGTTPDWEFLESLKEHDYNMSRFLADRRVALLEKNPMSASAIREGITSICSSCEQRGMEIPKQFEAFHVDKAEPEAAPEKETSDKKSRTLAEDSGIPSLKENLRNSAEYRQEAFELLSLKCIQKIKNGDISLNDLSNTILQHEIAPYYKAYEENTNATDVALKNSNLFQMLNEIGPETDRKVIAANVALADLFYPSSSTTPTTQPPPKPNMTSEFKKFFRSEKALKHPFFFKTFHDYSTRRSWINWGYGYFPTLALSSENFNLNKTTNIIMTCTNFPKEQESDVMLAHVLSDITHNANGIMSAKPRFHTGKGKNLTLADGFITKDKTLYHVFDPLGEIPVNYIFIEDIKKPWYPSTANIPCSDDAEHVKIKDISHAALSKKGVQTPKTLSFWTEKESLNRSHAQTTRKKSPDIHFIDDLSVDEITKKIERFFISENDPKTMPSVVTKPLQGAQGRDVIAWKNETDPPHVATNIAKKMLEFREQGEGAMVQEWIQSPEWRDKHGVPKDCCFRVWVAPNQKGESQAYGSIARIGDSNTPLNMSNNTAKAMFTEDWIQRLSEQHPELKEECRDLEERILKTAAEAHAALRDDVRREYPSGSKKDPLSFMGVDIVIRLHKGKLIPTVIETNGMRSGGMGQLLKLVQALPPDDPRVQKYKGGYLPLIPRADSMVRHATLHQHPPQALTRA